jgi:lipoate-protein ligase A
MIYLESKSFDPHFNLAMEQYIFDQMDRNEEYFFLWQNANTIVVGKHQNTIGEINQKFVEEHNISVVRRLSGGGAVYHDMGNLNFTIIVSRTDQMADFDFSRFCLPVVNALKKLGVKEILRQFTVHETGKNYASWCHFIRFRFNYCVQGTYCF